jgi:predicted helicase
MQVSNSESDKSIPESLFALQSLGVNTNRDAWVYNFDQAAVARNVERLIAFYNAERLRWNATRHQTKKLNLDDFVANDDTQIKWSSSLKQHLLSNVESTFDPNRIRFATYRPFTRMSLYFDPVLTHRPAKWLIVFPLEKLNRENKTICLTGPASEKPFMVLMTDSISDLHLTSPGSGTQCFPFYAYSEDGSNRRENITDWALEEFRETYGDYQITKWDIFYYTYAVLHHPEYRTRYAANLKRELPRIPFAPAFPAFVKAGKRLAELHVDYEKQKEYPLERREKPGAKLDYRVEKMRLSKDKQTLIYNDFLTLTGIPKETYDYRLGNRSALEWVIDQYQVSTDKRSGITNDPNREEDKEYILRLIGQVITVSLETVRIVNALPDLGLPKVEKELAAKTIQ